jgi:hypothetical protein
MYMTGSPSMTLDMGPMLARAGIMAIFSSLLLTEDLVLMGCSFEMLRFVDDCNLVTEKPSLGWRSANMRMTVITTILMHIIVRIAELLDYNEVVRILMIRSDWALDSYWSMLWRWSAWMIFLQHPPSTHRHRQHLDKREEEIFDAERTVALPRTPLFNFKKQGATVRP